MDHNDYRMPSSSANRPLSHDEFMSMSHEEFQALSSEDLRAFFLSESAEISGAELQTYAAPNPEPQLAALQDIAPQYDMMQFNELPGIAQQFDEPPVFDGDLADKPKKKSRLMGICAFVLAMLSALTMVFIFANAVLSYLDKTLGLGEIRLLIIGVVVAAALSMVAVIVAIVTYFMKRQKKGFAIATNIISVLILFISGMAIYGYWYMFGAIDQDDAFNKLSKKDLYIVEMKKDGEIVRETILPVATVEGEPNVKPGDEVEWEHLTNEDLPQEALDIMNSGAPEGKSYLKDGHKQILNFALFGLDEVGSSDSIIVFSLDKVHKKIKLISIPRDSYVQVPAWGSFAKMAYPYVWGGAEWAVGTINHNFAMNVNEYIAVDMIQLREIIDLIGGVEVDIDQDIEINTLWAKGYSASWGKCRLNGSAAVCYARIRDDSEKARTGRQREVLVSVLNSIKNKSMTEYPEFIRACLGMCTTSFENEQLMELCAEVLQNNYTIEQHALIEYVESKPFYLGQEQYLYIVYDLNRASDQLYRLIYEDLYISGYKD